MAEEGRAAGRCGWCGGPVPVAATGRPRGYCRQACRQAAYRARQAGGRRPAAEAARARELAGLLAGAGGLLARAVASPAGGDQASWQMAAGQAAAALAELSALAGVPVWVRDGTPGVVTQQGASLAVAAPPAGVVARWEWVRSGERSTWVAEAGGTVLAVTREAAGRGWLPSVRRPGSRELFGPRCPARAKGQRWAEQHAGDETTPYR